MSALLAAFGLSVPARLEEATFALMPGTLSALVGPNGAGKSTLLAAAAGLLPSSGLVEWGGFPLEVLDFPERARRLAWVPQEAQFHFDFTVREVVAQGRFASGDDGQGVDEALVALDLAALAARPVTRLSGGERQRVVLARALATGAPAQLWDEPLAQLDVRHALEVLSLARRLADQGGALLVALHDLRLALCFDQVLVLHERRLAATGKPEEVLTPAAIRRWFGVQATVAPALTLSLPRD